MRNGLLRAAVPVAVACALSGCGDSKTREEGRAQLTQRTAEQLEAAAAKASGFDFDGANAILGALRNEVSESPFADVATYDKLTADIDAAYGNVSEQESEYRRKLRAGWKLTEGKLVSPEDQARALAEQKRKEEAERARRKAERERLAADAKAREDEAERAKREADAARRAADVKAQQEALSRGIESPVIVKVGDGELRVRFQFAILYIPSNIPEGDDILVQYSRTQQCGYSRFLFVAYRPSVGEQYRKPIEGFFRVQGRTEKLECRSTDQAVLRILRYDDEEGLCMEALAPGAADVVISLGGRSVRIPLKVVQVPIRAGDFSIEQHTGGPSHTKEDIIKILGLPDGREETLVGWPDSGFYAGRFFSPRPGASWRIQRWRYNKYPGAEIIFVGGSAAYCARSSQTFDIAESP